ncbi:autotransporter outer membrane beta-barrel domain-containing protein [uncultured Sutterella sp.]|uniref:autotransporter family protein n=1 Tax=uncultured Sutterella sp. TaxID=286133 RepID=UPI00259BF2C8|nr:autotransporter outer membrane beta-barrel domain-containing protein [uncultured Sutterella sp.]
MENTYSGATNVLNGDLIVKEGALGNTEGLNVNNEKSKVTIQGNQSGVQSLNVLGELRIESGTFTVNEKTDTANTVTRLIVEEKGALIGSGNLNITGKDSHIKSANASFSGAVTLGADSTTTIDDVAGLGTGSIAINGTLTGTFGSDVIHNRLTGTGTLSLPNAEKITLTSGTGFSGILDLRKDSIITFNAESAATLAATIKGASKLNVSGTGASFAFDSADKIAGIKDISLNKVAFTVDEMISGKNLSVTEGELTMSKKTELGDLTLTKTKLLFNAAGTPGTIGEADNHLSVNNLSITGENTIVLDTNQLVAANPGAGSSKVGLTAQDVFKESRSSDLTTVLITTKDGVKGDGTFKLVGKNNEEISDGDKTFGIADEAGKRVADGIYGYSASVSGGNVGISWQLKTVSILDGETLSLSEREGEDSTLSANLTGSGSFEAKKGTITLAAENDYSGATHVQEGARLVAANDKALGKSKDIRNAGTLVISDRKNVAVDGAVENTGTIEVGLGHFRTATYEGKEGSVIALGAHVTADDAETGKFVVDGAATGTSRLDLSITDASVGRAVSGIDVVELGDGSTLELELGKSIKVGDYYYRLMKSDNGLSYYLISTLTDSGSTALTTSELRTPEAGARAALAFMNQRAFDFGLNSHIGEKSYADPFTGERKTTSLWLIQGGSWSRMDDSSGQLRNDGHMTTTNLGGDLYAWNNAGGRFSVGLMGGWVDGSYDVDSNITGLKADADFDGWSLGAYAAWQHEGESGLFANAQVRWNDFTNEVKGQGLAKEKFHARGLSLGVEAGWNQRLWTAAASDGIRAMAWNAAPFARATWSGVSADDHTDAYGQSFSVEGDGNVAVTLGARTSFEFGSKDQTPRFADPIVRVYAEGAWVHNTKTFESTVVNDKGASTAEFAIDDYGQFRLGFEGEFTKNFRLWGDVTHEAGRRGYSSTGFTVGAKYVF